MLFVEIARPPDDIGRVAGEIDHMLAGAAAGFDDVAGFAREKSLQYRPDGLMIAVKRRRVETAVGLDRPAVLAEFHDIFSHNTLPDRWAALAYPLYHKRANRKISARHSTNGVYDFDRLYSDGKIDTNP